MRLRFSIRDVLGLTLIVGLALGWMIDRRGLVARYQQLNEEKKDHEVDAEYWRRLAVGLRDQQEPLPPPESP